MKKIIVIGCMFLSVFSFGQNEKSTTTEDENLKKVNSLLSNSTFEVTIDKTIYPIIEGNSYFTEDQKNGILIMLVPASFEKMKESMNNNQENDGIENLDKGSFLIDGKEVLFMKKLAKKDNQEFLVFVYCKSNDAETSITVTSFFEKSKENIYKLEGEKAIQSAKLVK